MTLAVAEALNPNKPNQTCIDLQVTKLQRTLSFRISVLFQTLPCSFVKGTGSVNLRGQMRELIHLNDFLGKQWSVGCVSFKNRFTQVHLNQKLITHVNTLI